MIETEQELMEEVTFFSRNIIKEVLKNPLFKKTYNVSPKEAMLTLMQDISLAIETVFLTHVEISRMVKFKIKSNFNSNYEFGTTVAISLVREMDIFSGVVSEMDQEANKKGN